MGWHRPAGSAVQHHHAQWGQAGDALVEGVLPHGVVDYVDALASGGLLGLLCEVLLRVVNHHVGSSVLGKSGLRRGGHGSDGGCADVLGQLNEKQAHSTCPRVYQASLTGLQLVGAHHQIVGRHALQEGGSCRSRVDVVG